MNSSHNERTDIAPFQILFGNSVDLERGILTPFEETLPKPISLTKTTIHNYCKRNIRTRF
jgi:hypothetical protein